MGYKIFANLTIGTDNLSSEQKLEVQNFIYKKFDVLPIPGIANQWLFPIEVQFSEAHDKVAFALYELTQLLNRDRLVYTVNFSDVKWKSMELSVSVIPQKIVT